MRLCRLPKGKPCGILSMWQNELAQPLTSMIEVKMWGMLKTSNSYWTAYLGLSAINPQSRITRAVKICRPKISLDKLCCLKLQETLKGTHLQTSIARKTGTHSTCLRLEQDKRKNLQVGSQHWSPLNQSTVFWLRKMLRSSSPAFCKRCAISLLVQI